MHESITPELIAQLSTQGGLTACLIGALMFVIKKFLVMTKERDEEFLKYFNESRADVIKSIQNNTDAMNALNKTIRETEEKNMIRHSELKDKFSDVLIKMESHRPRAS